MTRVLTHLVKIINVSDWVDYSNDEGDFAGAISIEHFDETPVVGDKYELSLCESVVVSVTKFFYLNDCVESLETGKKGIIQATYSDGKFLMYTGKGYEHLYPNQMKRVDASELPFSAEVFSVKVGK